MQKVIAGIIALTAVICTFIGCEKKVADDVEDKAISEVSAISEEEATTQEGTTENGEYITWLMQGLSIKQPKHHEINKRKKT
ncbi:hypothetical protein [uncultured Ruminococcus sp.]|uniref:hypothetical protein n=1 Tax=uncultured Ruminococcus sp. TaxID=165186 RepID=UPI00262A9CF6|nr:hypothetical protein [uncultured Ruminococcus sp.]